MKIRDEAVHESELVSGTDEESSLSGLRLNTSVRVRRQRFEDAHRRGSNRNHPAPLRARLCQRGCGIR